MPLTPGVPAPTPGVVRTRIRATDPRTFEIISGQPQFVELFAYWSKTSQSMAPVVHALEDGYDDRIRFVYLDIDDPQNSLFKALIEDRLPPLFFLLDGQGNVLGEWQGFVPAAEFESAFAGIQP
jgi:thiol-disulfide isomerase/thioredoxin